MADPNAPVDEDRVDGDRKPPPSRNRIVLWIIGIGVGGYLVISGLIGILSHH